MGNKPARPAFPIFAMPARWPAWLLLLSLLLSVASAFGLTRLRPDARVDLLIDPGSAAFKDQALFADTFGADPIVILAQPTGNTELVTPDHIVGLSHLEGKLHLAGGVKKVYGPGTLVNTLAISTTTVLLNVCAQEGKAADAAARQKAAGKSQAEQDQLAQQAFQQAVAACAQRYAQAFPSLGVPAVNNPTFIRGVLYEPDGQHIRPFWTWALPDTRHALITVRLDRNASIDQVRQVIDIVRTAAASSDLKELHDLRFTATGSPALTLSVADDVFGALRILVPLALVAMLVVGLLVLGPPMLLTIPVAGLAALWAGAIAGFSGLPVTPATLAVLPVVLGLATDYLIQSTNRIQESDLPARERVEVAARRILPATGLAALATAAGMLAFVASGIPLVRQFGLFMAIGVVMAYLANFLVGLPALALLANARPGLLRGRRIRATAGLRIARVGRLPLTAALAITAIGLAGWLALPFIGIETDPAQLVPAGDPALAQAQTVQREVGLAGEIDLVLQGTDPTTQEAVRWLDAETKTAASKSAGDLKPLESLPAFLAGFNQGTIPDAARAQLILDRIPGYFSGAIVDRQRGLALSIFGLTHVTSVERDRTLVSQLKNGSPPPSGFRSFPAGLAVIADLAVGQLQADQIKLTVLAILLILVVLAIAYRNLVAPLLAVLPTVIAAGAATGLLYAVGVALNHRSSPITILLGGVVVAFATEFGVLWLSRYRSERREGNDPQRSASLASERIGPAIAASALALIAGFAVLGLSPVPTVRDFGVWSAFDLALATIAVLALLPPMARAWLR